MSTALLTSNWQDLLACACEIFYFDATSRTWKTNDGNWYSLSAANIKALEETIELLIKVSKDGIDRQWIIADKGFDFIKNILACPSPNPKHEQITFLAWQLMFNLVSGNPQNQRKIWKECHKLLLNNLEQSNNDTCRIIVLTVYSLAGLGQEEGTKILKIMLKSFHREKRTVPLNEQGLTCFLTHFITEESNITLMYLQLSPIEKMALLQYTVDYVTKVPVYGYKDPVSLDLLSCICNDFNAKSVHIFNAFITDDSYLQEFLALFEVIFHISRDRSYKMNRFDFELLMNVGRLIGYVLCNEDVAERTFSTIKRNCDTTLTEIMLSTVSYLVEDNDEHKEKARDSGLIANLIDFMAAKGSDGAVYTNTLFAIIDVCQTNPLNMEFAALLVKNKDHTRSEVFKHFPYDLTYKGRRNLDEIEEN